jgi:hypothetical protein
MLEIDSLSRLSLLFSFAVSVDVAQARPKCTELSGSHTDSCKERDCRRQLSMRLEEANNFLFNSLGTQHPLACHAYHSSSIQRHHNPHHLASSKAILLINGYHYHCIIGQHQYWRPLILL